MSFEYSTFSRISVVLLTDGWGLCDVHRSRSMWDMPELHQEIHKSVVKREWSGDQVHVRNNQEMFFLCISQTAHSICSISLSFNEYLYLCLCFLLTNDPPVSTFLQEKQGLERDYTSYDTSEENWKELKLSSTQEWLWWMNGQGFYYRIFNTEYCCSLSALFLLYLHHDHMLL